MEIAATDFLDQLLKNEKYDVVLLTDVMAYSGMKELVKRYPNLVYCRRTPHKTYKNYFVRLFWKLYKPFYLFKRYRILRRKYDIIIDYKNLESLHLCQHISDTPKVAWLHGSMKWVESIFTQSDFSDCDYVICLSQEMERILSSWFTSSSSRSPNVRYIYNKVDKDAICTLARTSSFALPLSPYFIYVARLDKDKDAMTVLDAYYEFEKEHNSGVHLYIIGDGIERSAIEARIEEINMKEKIHTLGFIDRPYFYMKHALANILSSYSEGVSMVLLEAMALGTLNIASDCPSSIKEVLLNGEAGLLFTPGSVEELKERFCDVYYRRVDIDTMIQKATDSLSRFDTSHIMSRVDVLINEIIQTYTRAR